MGCTISQNMRTMGGAFGIMDALRIGPDNTATWTNETDGVMRGIYRGGQRYFFNGRVLSAFFKRTMLSSPTFLAS